MKFFFNNISVHEKILIFIIFLGAFFINYHYASKGVFPIDSFAFFDSGFRILIGSIPFKDYWTISGPAIDYLQSLFFLIFGVSWSSYIIHSSLINSILALATFFFLKNIGLNKYYCFFYSACFAFLAYPSAGVPFPDHHSAFFSLLAVYSFIYSINNNKKVYWVLLPLFFFLAFFSKQTPATYIIIALTMILILYSIAKKDFSWFIPISISTSLIIILLIIFLIYQEIDFNLFLTQYFYFPQSIGGTRIKNLDFSVNGFILNFKFIYLASLPIIYLCLKNIIQKKNFAKTNKFFINLTILLLTLSLIFHQVLTKNQIFIFFLIPILAGVSHSNFTKEKNSKLLIYFLISLCIFTSIKYHLRFNENRKFMELANVNFNLSKDAKHIDKKINGLKWINPVFHKSVEKEFLLLKDSLAYVKADHENVMLLTHYNFFSAVLNTDLLSPNRWYTNDGISYPLENSEYYLKYKEYLKNLISKKNVNVIYTVKPIEIEAISFAFEKDCMEEFKINEILHQYKLHNCY